MLLERDELTSGSTWHAAGLLPLFNMGYATTHIHEYSVKFYKSLEAETGLERRLLRRRQPAHGADRGADGRVPASTPTTAETVGVPHEFLTPAADHATAGRWCGPRT